MAADPITLPGAGTTGRSYWRSLEEQFDTEAFRAKLHQDFPEQLALWTNPVTRRQFLALMGASLALAGMSGCSPRAAPRGKIMPYVRQPEALVPGKPLYFATAMPLAGVASPLLVESHEGRPTKIEGNPNHPASLGATDLFSQASILGLYDPDRSQSVTYRGRPRAWNEALSALRSALEKQRESKGAGLRILTGTVTSPTLAGQLKEILVKFPEAKWYQYEPVGRSAVLEGSKLVFGEYFNTVYDFGKADRILALDADFLCGMPGAVRYTHDFSDRRRVRTRKTPLADVTMSRLYSVESTLSNTGGVADHRLALRASEIEAFARALAAELDVKGATAPATLPGESRRWLKPLAEDLKKHSGKSIVVVGDGQPASLHAIGHLINAALGNIGQTVRYTAPIEARPVDHGSELAALTADMTDRRVEMLVMLGCNPAYASPADLRFAENLAKVPLRFHLGLYEDETALLCDWHIPEAHYLECWSDARAYDGTATIVQPLIAPLFGGRSAHELLAAFSASTERAADDLVRSHWHTWWKENGSSGDFEMFWQRSVQEGLVAGSALPTRTPAPKGWAESVDNAAALPESSANGSGLEIVFRPDPTLFDGRFANNGWLQELPKPVTKLTWDNAALMSPKTAEKLGIKYIKGSSARPGPHGGEHGEAIVDVVDLTYQGRTVRAPVWIQPGHADESITVYLGHGRKRAGHVGTAIGFNAYELMTNLPRAFDAGLQVRKVPGQEHTLACTQMHHSMEERRPIRTASLEQFKKNPLFAQGHAVAQEQAAEHADKRLVPLSLYGDSDAEFKYNGYKWGMAIDLSVCTGCSACVVACQSENNIPVVGKEQVTRGHEMHWLRIDRYYEGDPFHSSDVSAHFQPVPCMHCEKAPCELVCPVGATVHSHDGLNDMVYNRCVGTRYCSNNCPYKVRRFNFLQYADFSTASLQLMRNPEVTTRSRGVMEKCTYCVQRIRSAEIDAEKDHRRVTDRDLLTACQAVCPAQAISFGDINNPASSVAHWKKEPTDYGLLADLNTQPRTTYLASLRNPNPELEK